MPAETIPIHICEDENGIGIFLVKMQLECNRKPGRLKEEGSISCGTLLFASLETQVSLHIYFILSLSLTERGLSSWVPSAAGCLFIPVDSSSVTFKNK